MSQELIMEFLDKHKGQFFTAKEIFNKLNKTLTISNIHTNVKKIIKREEYKAYVGIIGTHLVIHYGRI